MLTHCFGVYRGESLDDVQGDDGNAIALLGSFCLTTLRVVAKLHVYREAYRAL